MEPHARVSRSFNQRLKILLKMCGHDFIGVPFKPNSVTYFLYAILYANLLCAAYTFAYYGISAKFFCVLVFMIVTQVRFDRENAN